MGLARAKFRMHACLRACVCANVRACSCAWSCMTLHGRVRACMRACVHAFVRACVRACMHACVRAWPMCMLACLCKSQAERWTIVTTRSQQQSLNQSSTSQSLSWRPQPHYAVRKALEHGLLHRTVPHCTTIAYNWHTGTNGEWQRV